MDAQGDQLFYYLMPARQQWREREGGREASTHRLLQYPSLHAGSGLELTILPNEGSRMLILITQYEV